MIPKRPVRSPTLRTPSADHVDEVHFAFLDGAPDSTNPTISHSHRRLSHPPDHPPPPSLLHLTRVLVFLILLGIIPSTIIFLVDISVHNIFHVRENTLAPQNATAIILYVLSGLVLCVASTAICHVCSTHAEGSGIPAMKCLMSGFYDKIKPALSLWALLAKTVGLVCAIGGGLPVGWEGPNVHIACIVAHHLSRLPPFRPLRRDRALRMQIMACACAVGLASSFGTPIGGVLYALETTASFYLVPTFWKCMLATLAGSLVYDLLYKTPLVEAFANTSFEASDYTREQLFAFTFLGVLLGLLGAFFVRCVQQVYYLRKQRFRGANRYLLLSIVGIIAALVQYPQYIFRLDPRQAINEFFSADNMESLSRVDVALLVLIKFPLIVISIGLPIPAGVFIPCFLVGSGLGRLYGELLRALFGANIVPGGYAVVGAAAFTAGVTRALSVAVVIFEVTGQLKHMVPTLAAVLVSVVVANGINRSLYDTLIIMKQLPYMPHMRRDRSPSQRAYQIMHTDVIALNEDCTLGEIRSTLDTYTHFDSFPVVSDDGLLLGSVRRRLLLALMNNGGKRERRFEDHDQQATSSQTTINAKSSGSQDLQESLNMPVPSVMEADLSENTADRSNNDDSQLRQHFLEDKSPNQQIPVQEYGQDMRTVLEPDLSPLVVTANTSLSQLHFMFVMLMPTHAYVLVGGVLQGVVTRGDLVQSGNDLPNPVISPAPVQRTQQASEEQHETAVL